MANDKSAYAPTVLICMALVLQSCAGWGDVFEQKRTVVGPYFLMTSGNGQSQSLYYLFRRDTSGSITGPIEKIGWNQKFVLVQGLDGESRIFPLDPQRLPLPSTEALRRELEKSLRQFIVLRSPQQV